ncbi:MULTISPECIES: barstar family protein [unclassified Burkholderia]|uniref:barstar family protein n=1 Tax=unclassified Burkholderia TaxID=2613784 RepID=UPI00158892E0|nr:MULTISPECIES: barstar family protein [unclassified Burkholderia]
MTIVNPFRYEAQPSYYSPKDAFVAMLPATIGTKNDLLEALASSLVFPAYFGFNWDALFDCLRDFSWLDEHDIVLVHPDLPLLQQSELKIYLRLLRDSVLDWRPDEAHRFEVVFAESDKEAVERMLRE